MSLSSSLVTASNSLNLFSLGIQVSGNNIANANTPGFTRDQLIIASSPPYQQGNLLIGTGAYAVGIKQQADQYLDGRIQNATSDYQLSSTLGDSYKQLESALQSLGDNDLSAQMSDFVTTLQAAVNQPENSGIRSTVVDQAQTFADNIRLVGSQVDQLKDNQTVQINGLVGQANDLLATVMKLNPQISQLEANGLTTSDAGGLRNQRQQALDQLSQLIPIRVVDRGDGGVDVYTGSDYLILGSSSQQLQTVNDAASGAAAVHVQTSVTHSQLDAAGGQLTGLIEGRDSVLQGFTDQLDRFTAAVISDLNGIHASGEGVKGFTSVTGTYAVSDANAALNTAGLAFPPQNGSFNIKVLNTGTGITETTNMPVDLDGIGTDTSLTSLASSLNGAANVTATITSDGKLQLSAAPGYEIRFGDDTSGTLAALGINTLFTGTDSSNIGVNDVLKNDAGFLATGQGGGPSDNRNAVLLASAFDQSVKSLNDTSPTQFWNQTTTNVAQASAAQSAVADGLKSFQDALTSQREQQSGVNLDEELIKILQFQHSYQAAAHIVTTVETLMNTLLNI